MLKNHFFFLNLFFLFKPFFLSLYILMSNFGVFNKVNKDRVYDNLSIVSNVIANGVPLLPVSKPSRAFKTLNEKQANRVDVINGIYLGDLPLPFPVKQQNSQFRVNKDKVVQVYSLNQLFNQGNQLI
jgi:hypothetical protein